jgi:peptidoglycan/LPS O-acetylase OafA/YrhL
MSAAPSASERSAEPRLHALDGLRGAAAVSVVAFHVFGHTQLAPGTSALWLASPLGALVNGPGAVHVFFVLSGYVLGLTLSRDDRPGRIARFHARRVFRIHPPYVVAVLLAWAVSQNLVPRGVPDLPWVRIPAERLPLALAFPSLAFGLLPVGWSLFVELAQSLLFPLLFAAARGLGIAIVLAGAALLLLPLDPRLSFLRFTFDFALGLALFLWSAPIARALARLPAAAPALLGVAGLVLLQLPYMLGLAASGVATLRHGHAPAVVVQFALGSALLLVAALHAPALRRALESPLAAWFGRVSYSLYLVHYTVLMIFVLRAPSHSFSWPVALGVFAATLAISSALAQLGWHAVEAPSIRVGRALFRRREAA